jgi:predicted branched-subunit amino acid permease
MRFDRMSGKQRCQEGTHMATASNPSRRSLLRSGISIGVSTVPFGVAFGVACTEAGLKWWEALGFSTIVFGGSAQFAAVGVLADGGAIGSAIAAGGLLNLRSLAFGLLLAPALTGPFWWRALASQLMIDESTAVAVSADDPALRRYGYLAGGLSVFVLWNLSTLAGALVVASAGDVVERWGLDATIPAAFLALLWPRLRDPAHRRAVAGGLVIATALVPIAPPGIPIVAAALGVLAGVWRR